MKRILALILALCLLLCLCACEKDNKDTATTSSPASSSTPSSEPAGSTPSVTKPATSAPSVSEPDTPVPPVDEPATAYQKLYTYIVENGEAQDDIWVYTFESLTMTATSDGAISWKVLSSSGTMSWELELQENSQSHNLSVKYLTYSASAILEDAKGTLSDFKYSAPDKYADTMLTWLKDGISLMMNTASQALVPTGTTLSDFLPAGSSDVPPVDEPPVDEPPVDDEPPAEQPDPNIDPAILGRYRLYKMEDSHGTYDYNTVVASRGYAYIQLNADGTADVCDSGKALTGLEWDVKNMIIRDNGGQTLWPSIEGDTLTISQGPNKLIYVHEDSETWDTVATGHKKLHDYIVKKGTMQGGSYVVNHNCRPYYEGVYVKMIADQGGNILWEFTHEGSTVTITLDDNQPTQSVTMLYNGNTCTAEMDLSAYIKYSSTSKIFNFQTDADSTMATSLETQANSMVSTLVQLAKLAMEPSGVSLQYLCYT